MKPGDYICGGSGKPTPEAEIELADIAAYLKAKSEKTFTGKYVDWRKAYPLNLRGTGNGTGNPGVRPGPNDGGAGEQ